MNAQRITKGRLLGEVLADFVAEKIGSWGFVATQTLLIAVWMALNATILGWDPYPFILLNLLLSLQAAYTGPVLLISANRQGAVDRRLLHLAETHARQAEHHARETHTLMVEMRRDHAAMLKLLEKRDV